LDLPPPAYFEAVQRQPSKWLRSSGAHPDTTKAGGYANRNAGFIRQPQCGSPACRMNPALRWWYQDALAVQAG
ncbi:MAG: hypothetical protein NT154_19855, partial [Verrucomicrobia bacterium]|nr:hypothetical protein [Verrucomicrobiota bacterium]